MFCSQISAKAAALWTIILAMPEGVKLLLSDFYQLTDTMHALAVLKYFFP
jgi:hypothetical protein